MDQHSQWHKGNASFAFWNFLGYFFPNIFYLQLVQSMTVKPEDTEGYMYLYFSSDMASIMLLHMHNQFPYQ